MHTPKEPRMTPRRKAVGKASPMRSTATKPRHKGHGCNEEPRMNPRRKAVGKASATLTVVAEAQGRGQGIADAQHRHRTKAQGPRMHRGTPDDPLVKKKTSVCVGRDEEGGRDESERQRAESQWIVAARPLCHLQYPVAYLSRLQRILPAARWKLRFKEARTARPPHGLHLRHVP